MTTIGQFINSLLNGGMDQQHPNNEVSKPMVPTHRTSVKVESPSLPSSTRRRTRSSSRPTSAAMRYPQHHGHRQRRHQDQHDRQNKPASLSPSSGANMRAQTAMMSTFATRNRPNAITTRPVAAAVAKRTPHQLKTTTSRNIPIATA